MLQAALWYAELGYPVFPCAPGAKQPLTGHGLLDATTDEDEIEAWWRAHPDANVAIRTDGLLVVDLDGADNLWLSDQPARLADLDVSPQSLTPHGGRQFVFRQPQGKAWRNTVGRLASRVDTRADGGYILVPPSVVDGKPYQWCEGRELSLPPDRLPEPPAWLIDQLDAIPASSASIKGASSNMIPEGQRNATLARLAGAMRRVGMSHAEICAALRQVNADRCNPPLPAAEIDRIAASISRYEPNAISVALAEDHWVQNFTAPPAPLTLHDLLTRHPMLRPPVIQGLLRRGETMNVIAQPKAGKSWLVLSLAMSVAAGRRWLDSFETVPGPVLILDNELHLETLAHRVPRVAEAMGVGLDEIRSSVCVQSLRGQLRDLFSLRAYFDSIEPGRFALVVLDAFYRFLPMGCDENDNGTMANLYNHVDRYADQVGCSFVIIHHSTKGNQSAKAITDVGAGAGSQSRATDTHLVLRAHEEPGAAVLEAAVRSWAPVEPRALRWEFPLWKPATDLDPARLKSERPKRRIESGSEVSDNDCVRAFVKQCVNTEPRTREEIVRLGLKAGYSKRAVQELIRLGVDMGLVYWWGCGRYRPSRFATVKMPTESRTPQ